MELLVSVIGPVGSLIVRDRADSQGMAGAGEHRIVFIRIGYRPAQNFGPEVTESGSIGGIESDHGKFRDWSRIDSGRLGGGFVHLRVSHVCHS